MNKLFLLFAAMLGLQCHAQTFTANGGPIRDFNGGYNRIYYPIQVSGLPKVIDSIFGLETIGLNISHPRVADLKIELMSPDSTTIWLTNRNGGDSGKNYVETNFNMRGFNGYIYEAKAPFTGQFIPDGKISFLNNRINPNGTWYLVIQDLAKGKEGILENFRLTFGTSPPMPLFRPCNKKNAGACVCPGGGSDCDLLPDLIVSTKMTQILHKEYAKDDPIYPGQLRLAVATANVGSGPMELKGSGIWMCGKDTVKSGTLCKDGKPARQIVYQQVYHRKGDSLYMYKIPAGTNYFESMPGHNHYHADGWIEMTLRKPKGKIKNPLKWPILGKSSKVSYCLFDFGNCTSENGLCQDGKGGQYGISDLSNYGFGHYPDCESILQGISVGGLDNYGLSFEGQEIHLPPDLKNGDYFIVVEVDPIHLYKEEREDNNFILIPIKIELQNHGKH